MKNTTKILTILVHNDRPMNRKELETETGLSKGVISGSLFFLKGHKLINVKHISVKEPPIYRRAVYSFNPEKGKIIIKLLKEGGVELA